MRALIVVNPVSGPRRHRSFDACSALARAVLAGHGVEVEVQATRARGDARVFAERAVAAGVDLVVAWGGDGTINEVASGLASSPTTLGIVPGGSGNGLARDLGIPFDAEQALTLLVTGRRRRIDAGALGGSLFFNVAGVGLDALIAASIARPGVQRGLSGYARITFLELPRYRAERYTIEHDGERTERRALIIACANSRQYGNGAQIAPAARLDDGRIDLVVVEPQPLWRIAARLPDLFRGRLRPGPGLSMQPVTSAVIRSERPIAFHVDGEPGLGGTALTLQVHPAAISVVTP